jgi:8-oxo-dGTP diphosphatase
MPIVNVAAAVILKPDGEFLLAQRPAGKPWAGYWEFPGGKFENGEDERAALARELHEELGIELDESFPWITRLYAYPERTVRLHFHRVTRWHGEPHGRENQALAWQSPADVTVAPLLPANAPVLRALALPAIYGITAAVRYGEAEFLHRLDAALAAGLRLIQLREPDMQPPALEAFAREVVRRARVRGARVLIAADAELAERIQADGVHLPAAAVAAVRRRPALPWVAASCHDRAELEQAARLECDFAVLSPVLPTASHPGAATLGWDGFEALVRNCPIPVYALGGMKRELLATAMRCGAHGVALLSGIW